MCELNCATSVSRPRARILLAVLVTCGLLALACGRAAADDAQDAPATQPAIEQADQQSLVASGLDRNGSGITLNVNQSRLLLTRVPMHTVDVTQPDIVLVKLPTATNIVLTGRKPGNAQLVLFDDNGRSQTIQITVTPDLGSLNDELKRVLPNLKLDVSTASGAIVLKGQVPDARVADQAVQIATPYAAKVINLLEVSGGQQVTLQVRFAEVSKSAIEALGVNFGVEGLHGFGASVIGQVAPFGVVPSKAIPDTNLLGVPSPGSNVTQFGHFTAGKTPFDVFLTAMKNNNLLRVLAEPNLTTMSGQQASFLAGGEFPYPVPQSSGTGSTPTITLEYKTYGVKLTFTPVVLGDGRIRLQVNPEVSALDYTNALQLEGFTIPAITTRTANTVVELNEGQTLALAGLLNTRVSSSNNATPLLGQVPILGALFRSVRYERDETELVVLVTPRLAAGMNPGQVPALPGEHWRYPTEASLFGMGDLGGPKTDVERAPQASAPRKFQGTYGFAPVTASGSEGGK